MALKIAATATPSIAKSTEEFRDEVRETWSRNNVLNCFYGQRVKHMILEPISNISNQVKSLQTLKGDVQHPGHVNAIELLDNSIHVGPNGIRQCLVSESLGLA